MIPGTPLPPNAASTLTHDASVLAPAVGSGRRGQWARHRALLLIFGPALLYFAVFHYGPMVGLVLAFKRFISSQGIWGSEWVGLANFEHLLASPQFHSAFWNTLLISGLRLLFGFFAPIVLALLLNELRVFWFKRAVQTVTYIPYLLSWVILGGIFLLMFSSTGPVNQAIAAVTGTRVGFLSDDFWFLVLLIGTGVWHSVGYGAVIYLAAISSISPELYEAATVDGANRWHQVRHVTLPALAPTIVVLLILNLGHIMNAGFDQIYNLYNPVVYSVADVVDTFALRQMIQLEFGLSTASDLVKSAIGLALIVGANSVARRVTRGEQGIF
jgi:putative aldouronate transport system permease protein